MEPIARFHSPFATKFGAPRQSGVVPRLEGRIVFEPPYRNDDAIRGMDEFSHLWLLWLFSANRHATASLTVRPPRLGGNERMGVFATRSPYRPNPIGLSSVEIARIERHPTLGPVIHVLGADLIDGTPIVDIKPYIAYTDAHPEARGGFTDTRRWQQLEVDIPPAVEALFTPQQLEALRGALAQDPRPHYHDDPAKVYGMLFAGHDIHFTVDHGRLTVLEP